MARKILIDGGAHCGCTRRYFRHLHDKKKEFEIYSFEPTIELNKYCQDLINRAIWIEDGSMPFHVFEIRGGNTLNEEKAKNLRKQTQKYPLAKKSELLSSTPYSDLTEVRYVPTIDIDRWIKENFQKNDYIILKLDIEGAEYDVVRHMLKNGSMSYINKLFIEWHSIRCGHTKQEDASLNQQVKKLGVKIEPWDAMLPRFCFLK